MTPAEALHTLARVAPWSALTLACYLAARAVYRRWPRWWLMPLGLAPLLVGLALAGVHGRFADYYAANRWLVWLLGPSVTAFAVPIHDQWPLVRRYWRVLLLGIAAGSATALVSGWALASLLGIDGSLRLTLLPRSISTPFAMQLSSTIGGVPELTALFVVVTGVLGAVIGEVLLARLPLRTDIARGAMIGVGAHAAGTAHIQRVSARLGALSGLTMVLTGALNVMAAPLIRFVLGH